MKFSTMFRGGCWLAVLLLWAAVPALAETTNDLSAAELEGRQLARQLRNECPAESLTNFATLKIRDAKKSTQEIPIRLQVAVIDAATASWEARYETTGTNTVQVSIRHTAGQPTRYLVATNGGPAEVVPDAGNISFAGSDFWLGDFGLEFLYWPTQKIVKKEFHNNCASIVLESKNSAPTPGGYARVISRIEEESGGIMEAQTYDAAGRKLKDFRVKDLRKINGHWQVELIIMENVQTGSRTRLEFDLKK